MIRAHRAAAAHMGGESSPFPLLAEQPIADRTRHIAAPGSHLVPHARMWGRVAPSARDRASGG